MQIDRELVFRAEHQYVVQNEEEPKSKHPRIVITINTIDMAVSTRMIQSLQDLPDNRDSSVHVGCKAAKNIVRFYNRSAGVMAFDVCAAMQFYCGLGGNVNL